MIFYLRGKGTTFLRMWSSLAALFCPKELYFALLGQALAFMLCLMRKMQSMQYMPSESSSLSVLSHHEA